MKVKGYKVLKIKKFEDIISWQKYRELSILIYTIFNNDKDLNFRSQIVRVSVSIMNNIAEGFERQSNKEFSQFLYIAKGSSAEVRSMLYLAKDLNKIKENDFDKAFSISVEIAKLLSALIKTL